jgi:two-component system LytT family response regulator
MQNTVIKAIITDDEPMARDIMNGMLSRYCPDVTVLALCDDLGSTVKAIKRHKPDVVFLDIEMPNYSGLEIQDFFEEDEFDFHIVFVTAYSDYAVQAFKLSALDYILKPLTRQALEDTMQKLRNEVQKVNLLKQLEVMRQNLDPYHETKICIPSLEEKRFIPLSDIIYIQASGSYAIIHIKNDKNTVVSSRNLRHFEELLSEYPQFVRVHRGYLVNKQYVERMSRQDEGILFLQGGMQVEFSKDKYKELQGKLFV